MEERGNAVSFYILLDGADDDFVAAAVASCLSALLICGTAFFVNIYKPSQNGILFNHNCVFCTVDLIME